MNLRTSFYFCVIAFVLIFSFQSCNRTDVVVNHEKKDSAVQTSDAASVKMVVPSWHPVKKKICIVFGYGYNEKEFTELLLAELESKYGIDDGTTEGGLIYPLVFPDDFKQGSDARIMRLAQKLEGIDLAGLITIGAPENTNYALARLQEEWDNNMPFPVYSYFPQDDIMGMEATSDFVVDLASAATGSGDGEGNEEVEVARSHRIKEILDASIELMLLSEKPLPRDKNLYLHVKQLLGRYFEVSPYIDPETGVQQINHFVIEDVMDHE